MAIDRSQVTGLVLAGGRGSRMGGLDKGLQTYGGVPLVQLVLQRLAPQVGPLLVNANRNLDHYAAFGVPVVTDALGDYAGPLAGMLAGMQACRTPFLVSVPCDGPRFPEDLVQRLGDALEAAQAEVAIAATLEGDGKVWSQPVYCLVKASLHANLAAFLAEGQRKIDRWTGRQRQVQVVFDDLDAFFNANTPDDLKPPSPS